MTHLHKIKAGIQEWHWGHPIKSFKFFAHMLLNRGPIITISAYDKKLWDNYPEGWEID